jgi:2-succinyl-6-hydroxy-2,4-cyclohexadiene-1-carboxylate synthase
VGESIVLLHGFGGTHRAWDGVRARLGEERYTPLALDLPGHGLQADYERPITFAACVDYVLELAPERFALCGYSMGGRVALHVALAAPARVRALVLVATTAGIEDPSERALRREADQRIAEELQSAPFESFVERWRGQPLFAGEPPHVGALAREDHRRNRPAALARVLRGIGTGQMEPLWGRLGELRMPVTVLVGERDEKFRAIGRRMAEELPEAELKVLPGAHNLVLESPSELAEALLLVLHGLDAEPGPRR